MNRAKPLTVDVVLDDVHGGSSRIETAETPFSPEPLKIAFLPVSSITLMIFDGGSVPFILTICNSSEKEVSWMPGRVYRALDMSLIHESHVNGTEKVAS